MADTANVVVGSPDAAVIGSVKLSGQPVHVLWSDKDGNQMRDWLRVYTGTMQIVGPKHPLMADPPAPPGTVNFGAVGHVQGQPDVVLGMAAVPTDAWWRVRVVDASGKALL